tara:strand:- start:1387 stop:1671 length:285 start_codon:yes stop_codon:yes gene_type:complete
MASPKASVPRKSARNYAENPESYRKKLAYDKKYNARPEKKASRAEHGRARYAAKKMGKVLTGRDMSRKSDGSFTPEASSTNRARNGHGSNGRYK